MAADLEPVVYEDGTQRWYKGDILHRENGPAVIYRSGKLVWYKDGKIHRDSDLPAVNDSTNFQAWYINGKLHRDGDLPAVILVKGLKEWWKGNAYHREIGPARIRRFKPPKFYDHGRKRSPLAVRGETLVGLSPASWSPVMCFV